MTLLGVFSAVCAAIAFGIVWKKWQLHSVDELKAAKAMREKEENSKAGSLHTFVDPLGGKQKVRAINMNVLTLELLFIVGCMLTIYFFIMTAYAVYETITTPLAMYEYKFQVQSNSVMWTVIV